MYGKKLLQKCAIKIKRTLETKKLRQNSILDTKESSKKNVLKIFTKNIFIEGDRVFFFNLAIFFLHKKQQQNITKKI